MLRKVIMGAVAAAGLVVATAAPASATWYGHHRGPVVTFGFAPVYGYHPYYARPYAYRVGSWPRRAHWHRGHRHRTHWHHPYAYRW